MADPLRVALRKCIKCCLWWKSGSGKVVLGLVVLAAMVIFFAPQLPGQFIEGAFLAGHGILRPFDSPSDEVAIAVGPPAVQTRERLINDRFEQVAWTDLLLKSTMTATAPGLRLPDEVRRELPDRDLQVPEASQTDKPNASAGTKDTSTNDPERSEDSPFSVAGQRKDQISLTEHGGELKSWFTRMRDFRDDVRAERAVAMLDDRHDIDGDTLYDLSFNTSIDPQPGTQIFGAVEVMITNDPGELVSKARENFSDQHAGFPSPADEYALQRFRQLQRRDLFEIYFDWLERTQTLLDGNVDDKKTSYSSPDYPQGDLLFLLKLKLCEQLLGSTYRNPDKVTFWCRQSMTSLPVPTSSPDQSEESNPIRDSARSVLQLVSEWERNLPAEYKKIYKAAWDHNLDAEVVAPFVSSLKRLDSLGRKTGKDALAPYRNRIANWLKNPRAAIPSYDELSLACGKTSMQAHTTVETVSVPAFYDIESAIYTIDPSVGPQLGIACPNYYRQIDKLLTLEALVRQLRKTTLPPLSAGGAGRNPVDRFPKLVVSGSLDSSEDSRVDKAVVEIELPPDELAPAIITRKANSVPVRRSLSCLAAFQVADVFQRPPLYGSPGRGVPNYQGFFDIHIIEPTDGDCSVHLMPKIISLEDRDTSPRPQTATVTDEQCDMTGSVGTAMLSISPPLERDDMVPIRVARRG